MEKIQLVFPSQPSTPTPKGKEVHELCKEPEAAVSHAVGTRILRARVLLRCMSRHMHGFVWDSGTTRMSGGKGCNQHLLKTVNLAKKKNEKKNQLLNSGLSTTRMKQQSPFEKPSSPVAKAAIKPPCCPAKSKQFPGNTLDLTAALPI